MTQRQAVEILNRNVVDRRPRVSVCGASLPSGGCCGDRSRQDEEYRWLKVQCPACFMADLGTIGPCGGAA